MLLSAILNITQDGGQFIPEIIHIKQNIFRTIVEPVL